MKPFLLLVPFLCKAVELAMKFVSDRAMDVTTTASKRLAEIKCYEQVSLSQECLCISVYILSDSVFVLQFNYVSAFLSSLFVSLSVIYKYICIFLGSSLGTDAC